MPTLTAPVALPQRQDLEMEDQEFELDIRISTIKTTTMTTDYPPTAATYCGAGCVSDGGSCVTCTNCGSCGACTYTEYCY